MYDMNVCNFSKVSSRIPMGILSRVSIDGGEIKSRKVHKITRYDVEEESQNEVQVQVGVPQLGDIKWENIKVGTDTCLGKGMSSQVSNVGGELKSRKVSKITSCDIEDKSQNEVQIPVGVMERKQKPCIQWECREIANKWECWDLVFGNFSTDNVN